MSNANCPSVNPVVLAASSVSYRYFIGRMFWLKYPSVNQTPGESRQNHLWKLSVLRLIFPGYVLTYSMCQSFTLLNGGATPPSTPMTKEANTASKGPSSLLTTILIMLASP